MNISPESLKRFSEPLLLLLAVVVLIRADVWMPLLITGESMLPTLHNGQIVGLNKVAYLWGPPQRGDIVAVWTAPTRVGRQHPTQPRGSSGKRFLLHATLGPV